MKKLRRILFTCLFTLVIGSTSYGATFTVTKVQDTNDGVCDADCSFREAISSANATASDDVITFEPVFFNNPSVSRTITLTGTALAVNNNGSLTVSGPELGILIVSGNDQSQIVTINSNAVVAISRIVFTQGNALAGFDMGGCIAVASGASLSLSNMRLSLCKARVGGGGISSLGTLTIADSFFQFNSAQDHGGALRLAGVTSITNTTLTDNTTANVLESGAGIYATGAAATTTIENSLIINNISTGDAGGISNLNGATLIVNRSTITGNVAAGVPEGSPSSFGGGGIYNSSGSSATISNTLIALNTIFSHFPAPPSPGGGGIHNAGNITLVNSTMNANNAGTSRGGAIYNSGSVNLASCTITENFSNWNGDGLGGGGGVFNAAGTTNARNTIIANNLDIQLNNAPDFRGMLISDGYNLIEVTAGATIAGTITGNILGQDPQFLPRRNNGGTTETFALLPTSPAIDAGDPITFPATDQRGFTRPRDGNDDGITRSDIGAFELRTVAVTSTSDGGPGSLRQHIVDAPGVVDAILFDNAAFSTARSILLTSGELSIAGTANLTIEGPGSDLLTISGNNQSRIIFVSNGASLTLRGATLTNGNANGAVSSGNGGAVYVDSGTLRLSDTKIINNTVTGSGGGISVNGTLAIDLSTISGNTGRNNGGGVRLSGSGTISRSNISNNIAGDPDTSAGTGGGLYWFASSQSSSLGISDTSIVENQAKVWGGGFFTTGNASVIRSSIAKNRAGTGGGIYLGGTFFATTLTATNSTISTNTASLDGGGIYKGGPGFTVASSFVNCTVARNAAMRDGGGIVGFSPSAPSFQNSIIADNSAGNNGQDVFGSITSARYNLIENPSPLSIGGNTTGNIIGVDPMLDPRLLSNGGLTPTHALRPGSPAIDKGSGLNPPLAPIVTDQRGLLRPYDFPSIPTAGGGSGNDSDIGAFERQATDVVVQRPQFDVDGDGKSDIGVFRPSNGTWYVFKSQTQTAEQFQFGADGDVPLDADFDGDFKADFSVWRPVDGTWHYRRSGDGTFGGAQWGANGDKVVAADYDADGKTDFAVWRPSDGINYIVLSTASFLGVQWGGVGDIPSHTDLNGDGKTDFAVFRPSSGTWYTLINGTSTNESLVFGQNGDIPVRMDVDADRKGDIAVWRPSTGEWFYRRSSNGTFGGLQWGGAGDRPVPGDYDGDGRTDFGAWRSTDGIHYIVKNSGGFLGVQWGGAGDIPILGSPLP